MASFRINTKNLYSKISKNKKFQQQVNKKVSLAVDANAKAALQEFESHPVTEEIRSGPNARNSSGTLGGYGNLFSFIGFENGTDPISPLSKLIKTAIMVKKIKNTTAGKQIKLRFEIGIPTDQQIRIVTPMPWEGGSWAEGIESGISGFSYYMYKKFGSGRSGMGLQTDHELGKAIFNPQAYVSEIIKNFSKNVRREIKKGK